MPRILLPELLRAHAGLEGEIEVTGNTVATALQALEQQAPKLRGWVLDEQGQLRRHVNVFLGDSLAELEEPVAAEDRLHILQAISGGEPARELLVGTRKGLMVLRGSTPESMELAGRHFAGQDVDFAVCDPRHGRYFAAVTHGQFGPRLFWATDPAAEWQQVAGLEFPVDTEATLERIWAVVPGEAEGELWAGVAPAALFHSTDEGSSWSLVRSLWDVPGRAEWGGGLGGLALHSICPWPGDPQRLAVGISAAGVWTTEDGGSTWRRGGRGLVPRYLPEEAREGATMLCVHNMRRAPLAPERMFMQFHGGVYRSDDAGDSWIELGSEGRLPADFGFPIEIDPRDPDSAFVIPLNSDEDRVSAEGRLRVFETRDAGASWQAHGTGLPQEDAYLTVLRQAFCGDGEDPLGLYFGTTAGTVYGSVDGGHSWAIVAHSLPPVLSIRASRR